jgi:hypothetical protein
VKTLSPLVSDKDCFGEHVKIQSSVKGREFSHTMMRKLTFLASMTDAKGKYRKCPYDILKENSENKLRSIFFDILAYFKRSIISSHVTT